MTDGLAIVQPFKAMLIIMLPAIRIGSNFVTNCNIAGCPSIGHEAPEYKEKHHEYLFNFDFKI